MVLVGLPSFAAASFTCTYLLASMYCLRQNNVLLVVLLRPRHQDGTTQIISIHKRIIRVLRRRFSAEIFEPSNRLDVFFVWEREVHRTGDIKKEQPCLYALHTLVER